VRSPERTKIEGLTYEVTPFGAGTGIAVLTKLTKLVGPAMGKVTSLKDAAAAVFAALGTLAERLDDEAVADVLRKLAEHTRVEPGAGSGKLVQAVEVLRRALLGRVRRAVRVGEVRARGELRPFTARAGVKGRGRGPRRFGRARGVTLAIPAHIAWPVHRIATSGRYHDGCT
jgi:hypothetical protein